MKPKTFSKKELNGKCPFCSFREIHKGMLSYGVKVGGNSNKLPEPKIEVWHCDGCKKTFDVIKNS